MLFSSIPFLFYFLPAVLLVYFLVPKAARNAVLLISSLVFYAWGEPKYVFLMIATIVLFYLCGLATEKAAARIWKKVWLLVSVVISIALLAVILVESLALLLFRADITILDWVVVGIMCMYIGYDWVRANSVQRTTVNAIAAASALYLDIINILLRVLRILSRSRRD